MSNINSTAIRRIKQDEFKTFADLVFDSMNGKTVYALFQTAVTDMQAKSVVFQDALIKSKSRTKEAIDAKNVAYDNLYQALVRIAKLMDAEWQNGLYNEGKKMELTFPFGSKLVVSAKTIGPNSLKSESVQSEEVMVS